jgi:hypothetical protein
MEKRIEDKLGRAVKKRNGLAVKFIGTMTGWPDRKVLMPGGKEYWVELKDHKGVLSERQKYVHKQLLGLNIKVWTIFNDEQLNKFLNYVDANQK